MKLFIVEDSPYIQLRLQRLLEDLPFVQVAGVAGDLQSALTGISAEVDIVLLDIQLGQENGLHLLPKILAQQAQIKFVVLSNHASEANRMLAARAGAHAFLDKSTDFNRIPELLQAWNAASDSSPK